MKQWLEENRIYFETAAATLLGVMAVLVSISQLLVARSQLLIDRENASPSIYANVAQIKNSETGQYEEEELRVYNRGAPAFSAESAHVIWLLVELRPKSGNSSPVKSKIALNGYYGTTMITESPDGLMFKMKGHKNHSKMNTLRGNFRELARQRGYFSEVNLIRYIKVSYRNKMDNRNTEYFYVETIGGSEKTPNSVGKSEFEDHRDKAGGRHFAEFGDLTAEVLLENVLSRR